MKMQVSKRLLSLFLTAAMLTGLLAVPVSAAGSEGNSTAETVDLEFEEIPLTDEERSNLYEQTAGGGSEGAQSSEQVEQFDVEDIVRVSVVLESPSAMAVGYTVDELATDNSAAERYREELLSMQDGLAEYLLEEEIVSTLTVKQNLTMAANMLSAEVKYGEIENIEAVEGVLEVIVETCYSPVVTDTQESASAQTATSNIQTGSSAAYDLNYTGAGSRIAIIDTGLDLNHKSFDNDAFLYSLEETARNKLIEQGVADPTDTEIQAYIDSLDLLDADEIESVRDKLNISKRVSTNSLYYSDKVPFGYNYVDTNTYITHDFDAKGEHGSHVAGIAAANRYVAAADGYASALDTVKTQGMAFDAQILVMKVFGRTGGAYDSDMVAAIEDALLLGADAINMSVGTTVAGFTTNISSEYQKVYDRLMESGAVLSISAGNSSYFFANALNGGKLYADDVNFDRVSAPGTQSSSMAVASVDNTASVHLTFSVGEEELPYYTVKNTAGDAKQLYDLEAKEYEYIFLTGYGYDDEDYTSIGGEEVVGGKIVFASRGGNAMTALTARPLKAAEYGAAACVVYNDRSGVAVLSFGSAECSIPSATTSKQAASRLLALSTPVYANGKSEPSDDNDKPLYYKGTLTITGDKTLVTTEEAIDPKYSEISYFSSWGVPGSLELKPELSAPGGGVYSVDGSVTSGDAYEFLSGTSMAAPQISGMAAVVAQYIQENGLTRETGLTVRQLTQSLLMSTATPLMASEGKYTSILAQGAGLANVGAAVSAESYILMGADATDAYADGKVKVELGDDPDRDGQYTFSFTINSLTDEELTYELSADLFTQSAYQEEGIWYQDTSTAMLAAQVEFLINGQYNAQISTLDCDLNGDGVTDAKDAQIILNHTAGLSTVIDSSSAKAALADVDGDGAITTYDAHLILSEVESCAVRIPAGDSVKVQVTVTYPETLKSYLDTIYPNGAYIEGFVRVTPVACADGGETIYAHSIPILGYYGNWSDPSMFDRTTQIGQTYANVEEPDSYAKNSAAGLKYIPYFGSHEQWFTGDLLNVLDEYPAGKEAVREDAILQSYVFTPMRNMAALMAFIRNETTGEYIYTGTVYQYTYAGYSGYTTSGAKAWAYQDLSVSIGKTLSTLSGISENDKLTVGLVAVPEYYGYPTTAAEMVALMESGTLGEGAYLTTTFALDNTAPELLNASVTGGTKKTLDLTIQDNQYVAYVALISGNGQTLCEEKVPVYPEGTKAGSTVTLTFDLNKIAEEKGLDADELAASCQIQLIDYAGNQRTYRLGSGSSGGAFYLFGYATKSGSKDSVYTNRKVSLATLGYDGTKTTGVVYNGTMSVNIMAAEYARGYVYMLGTDLCLYVAEPDDITNMTKVCQYDAKDEAFKRGFRDLTYHNGTMYALDNKSYNDKVNTVYTIDLLTGEAKKAFEVTIDNVPSGATVKKTKELVAFAIDTDGRFYAVNSARNTTKNATNLSDVHLYTWTLNDVQEGKVTAQLVSETEQAGFLGYLNAESTSLYGGSMTWDAENDRLLWLTSYCSASARSQLVQFTRENGEELVNPTAQPVSDKYNGCVDGNRTGGLYFVPGEEKSPIEGSDVATSIVLSDTELTLTVENNVKLTAEVFPWNLNDKSFTWSSDDKNVAIVNRNGVVTAMGAGETFITVTASAPGADGQPCTAKCAVTVQDVPEIGFSALIEDGTGTYWAEDGLNTLNFAAADLTGNEQESRDLQLGAQVGNTFLFRDEDNKVVILDADSGETLADGKDPLKGFAWDCITGIPDLENEGAWELGGWNAEGAPKNIFDLYLAAYHDSAKSKTYLALIDQNGDLVNTLNLSNYYYKEPVSGSSVYFKNDPIVAIAAGETGENTSMKAYPAVRIYLLTKQGALVYFDLYATYNENKKTVSYLGHAGNSNYKVKTANCVVTAENALNTMSYDEKAGKLLLFSGGNGYTSLYVIDINSGLHNYVGTRNGSTVQAVYNYTKSGVPVIRGLDSTAEIYTGKTVQLNAWVAPKVGDTSAVTWSSEDPTIATVDEHGVVTGVYDDGGKGTSTTVKITAAAAGDDTITADCIVTVTATKRINQTFTALVTDRSNASWWSKVSLEDLSQYEKQVQSSKKFLTAGWSDDGKLYGLYSAVAGSNTLSYLYQIDPETYEVSDTTSRDPAIVNSGTDISIAPRKKVRLADGSTVTVFGGSMVECGYLMKHLYTDDFPDAWCEIVQHDTDEDATQSISKYCAVYIGEGATTESGLPTLQYLLVWPRYAKLTTVEPVIAEDGSVTYVENRESLITFESALSNIRDAIYVPGEGLVVATRNKTSNEVEFWFVELDVNNWSSNAATIAPKFMGSLSGAYDIAGLYTENDVPGERDNTIYSYTPTVTTPEQPAESESSANANEASATENTPDSIKADGETGSLGDDVNDADDVDNADDVDDTDDVDDIDNANDVDDADEADEAENEEENAAESSEAAPSTLNGVSVLTGTTMAVTGGQGTRAAATVARSQAFAKNGTVTLELVSERTAANGLFTVKYDPNVLTYSGMTAAAALHAVSADTDKGVITVAYASAFAISAGDILSTLTFTYRTGLLVTGLSVDTLECGNALQINGESQTFLVMDLAQSGGGSSSGGSTGNSGSSSGTDDDQMIGGDGLQIQPCTNGHSGMVAIWIREDGQRVILKSYYDSETQTLRYDWDGTGEVVIVDNSKSFSDTAGHWASDAITFVTSRELFNGVGDGRFAPDSGMTRAMLVTVLHRLENEPKSGSGTRFSDVASGTWYTDAVYWAQSNGIVDGYGNGLFGTTDNITREQLAVMLYRYAKYLGLDISTSGTLSGFGDCKAVSAWAETAMAWAVENGIITGKPGGLLDPAGEVSRAEVAVMLQRMVRLMLQ